MKSEGTYQTAHIHTISSGPSMSAYSVIGYCRIYSFISKVGGRKSYRMYKKNKETSCFWPLN